MERQFTGIYYGPNTTRTAEQYASEWRSTGLGTIDDLILEQLQIADTSGRQVVRLLDIGSERFATALRGLVRNPKDLPQSRQFMQTHSSLSLDLIGLTDTSSNFEFGTPVFVQDSTDPNFDASLRITPYTLSAKQSLNDFLNQQGKRDIQIATAIWSLAYMGPNTFSEVLSNVSQALTQNGLFVGVGYAEAVAGLGFNVIFDLYPELAYLQRKNSLLTPSNWRDILGKSEKQPIELDNQRLAETKVTLSQSISTLLRTNIINSSVARQLEESIWTSSGINDLALVGSELQIPLFELWKKKFSLLKEKKDAKIRSLTENSNDIIVTTDFQQTIVVEKK